MCRTGNFGSGYNSVVSFTRIYTLKYILEFKGLNNMSRVIQVKN